MGWERGLPIVLTRRIIPCLDVRDRKVTKGVRFRDNVVLGDPVELAARYYAEGCDELVLYDITASAEHRPVDVEMVKAVARAVRVPFTVGGGISGLRDMGEVLLAGAEKVSVNTLAVERPAILTEGARALGSQCIVLSMDPLAVEPSPRIPSGYEITVRGFRERTGLDAVTWAREAEDRGAGEIVVNSVDADGTRQGFDLRLTRLIAEAVRIPVVASGGAGHPRHLIEVFRGAHADAAIVAGILHTGEWPIPRLKEALAEAGIPVRRRW